MTLSLPRRRLVGAVLSLTLVLPLLLASAAATAAGGPPESVRFATFNASLNRAAEGLALSDLSEPFDPLEPDASLRLRRHQAANVAEVIQRVRPEVLLINEFDYIDGPVDGNAMTDAFRQNYLEVGQNGAAPIEYPYVFVAPSNTGIASGFDLNNDGQIVTTPGAPGYGDDALGFGNFPGQFGMAVFSQHPIDYGSARTFQRFLWKDMPGALLPDDPATPGEDADWYSDDELDIFRLSSKSHWDVPIDVNGTTVHFLASHPTPPVFDGPEDRNGTRNHDEIRLWADYVTPGAGDYICDDPRDDGTRICGGLKPGEKFVIAGDQNSDPLDGDSIPGSIQQLIEHPRVNTKVTPDSEGAADEAVRQGRLNNDHASDPRFDTADFNDAAPGNLRADYVLPSRNLRIADAGVFWPLRTDPLFRLTGIFDFAWIEVGGFPTSDHRLVWIDVMIPGSARGS
jgi:hypothetical protein